MAIWLSAISWASVQSRTWTALPERDLRDKWCAQLTKVSATLSASPSRLGRRNRFDCGKRLATKNTKHCSLRSSATKTDSRRIGGTKATDRQINEAAKQVARHKRSPNKARQHRAALLCFCRSLRGFVLRATSKPSYVTLQQNLSLL